MKKHHLLLSLLAATVLAGCSSLSIEGRHDVAAKIAGTAGMLEETIKTEPFNLTTWQRVKQTSGEADVYIEGDGLAWLSRRMKSMNPTPPDPMTLRLAVQDPADNVIYMARPCQYTGWNKEGHCPDTYWTNGRTAPEVIRSYQQALDRIKLINNFTGFNLIGYSGGAAVAVLIAAERTDILSIRTVAGNTDYTTFSMAHGISPMNGSVNPVSVAAKISQIPQQHFVGENDEVVIPAIFESWKRASGETSCVHTTLVSKASHEKGWVEKWPEILAAPVVCTP